MVVLPMERIEVSESVFREPAIASSELLSLLKPWIHCVQACVAGRQLPQCQIGLLCVVGTHLSGAGAYGIV